MWNGRLLKEFKNPSSQHRLAPFWFWNYRLEDEEIKWQIREMKEKGIGGIVIHARLGLLTPYMGKEWLNKISVAIKEAERLDMIVWLYDEDNWPSGTASGKVLIDYPEYKMQSMYLKEEFCIKKGKSITKKISGCDEILFVLAAPIRNNKIYGLPERVRSLTNQIINRTLIWMADRDDWKIIVICKRDIILHDSVKFNGGYLDTLNRDAVKKFIEYTHEIYKDYFGKKFKKVILGMFTDEPGCYYEFWIAKNSLPYTKRLFDEFKRLKGYDLVPYIFGLFFDIGEKTAKVRCDFYNVQTQLYTNAYFKQIYDYCNKSDILSIGHPLFEGETYWGVRTQGDIFKVVENMHWAGVDYLSSMIWSPKTINNQFNLIGPKLISSAGHLFEKPRIMSEAFGVANPWFLNLKTLKYLGDWQVCLGANYFVPHAFYYTIQGFRKWECPPDEFYRAPYWPYYKIFSDHLSRLCALFSNARHKAKICVLYPVKSIYSAIDPDENDKSKSITNNFSEISELLLRLHYDYDYISEEILQNTNIESGKIKVLNKRGDLIEDFELIILPSVTTLSINTLKKIEEFVNQNGRIIFTDSLPNCSVEHGEDNNLRQSIKRIVRDKKAFFINSSGEDSRERFKESLYRILHELLNPPVIIIENNKNADEIIYTNYLKEEKDLFIFFNTSLNKTFKAKITIPGNGIPLIFNTFNGGIERLLNYKKIGSQTEIEIIFNPTQSYVIYLEQGNVSNVPENRVLPTGKYEEIELNGDWKFTLGKDNVLPLNKWVLRLGCKKTEWAPVGFHEYETEILIDFPLKKAKLLIDGFTDERVWHDIEEKTYQIFVNDIEIKEFRKGEYLDHYIREAEIGRFVRNGLNRIRFKSEGTSYEASGLSQMCYIIGDFAVINRRNREILVPIKDKISIGSWSEQGYPYYSGIGIYEASISIPKRFKNRRFLLKCNKISDLADVYINNKQAGILCWEPLELEITEFIRIGKNKIVIKVANTLQNILAKEKYPSGLIDKVSIIIPYK